MSVVSAITITFFRDGYLPFFFFLQDSIFLLWLEDNCINQAVCVGLTIIQCKKKKYIYVAKSLSLCPVWCDLLLSICVSWSVFSSKDLFLSQGNQLYLCCRNDYQKRVIDLNVNVQIVIKVNFCVIIDWALIMVISC